MNKQTILCVDDEVDNVEALERLFRTRYKVLKATSGADALRVLAQNPGPIAMILTDQRMPMMSGVEFLEKSLQTHPDATRILLTGYTDIESVIAAVNSGQIYRYLNKPWDPVDLMATVDRAVERFLMSQELKEKNAALEKALTELQGLDRAKNQFMILINHELKTPLTSILSYSELLGESKLDDEQKTCVARIRKSADRLKSLVDDSLLIVSAAAGQLKLRPLPFEFSQLSWTLSTEQEKLKQEKSLTLDVQLGDRRPIGDAVTISQVVRRIIHNALKFSSPQSTIKVRAEQTQPHRVMVSIENQGPGIPDSVRDHVLKPFFLDEDVMKHSAGVGLGLTVCQALLNAQGSSLQIQNQSGGVTLSFELACL